MYPVRLKPNRPTSTFRFLWKVGLWACFGAVSAWGQSVPATTPQPQQVPVNPHAGLVAEAPKTGATPATTANVPPVVIGPGHRGAAIYEKLCMECHGKRGEGVPDKYDEPLHGNRSVAALAKRIERTMPDDDVGACVGPDAQAVAEYIYEAFYSPAAQARLKPPEIELARLTVEQYRTSVTDLIGRFRPGFDAPLKAERGLKARYTGFAPEQYGPWQEQVNKEWKRERERAKIERTDKQVAVSFGESSPSPETMQAQEFNVRWEGSIIAEQTGTYEFILKSENGMRLWVNDPKDPLIDGWVGGTMREEKKSIYLLGGRAYPISIEFFKFKEPTASITLLWKPPHGVVETIPESQLSPQRLRQSMIANSPFPADDRSAGYERGTAVSKEWDQATTEAAIAAAEHVEKNLNELAGTKNDAPDRVDKLKDFSRRFAEAAFRRPLNDAAKALIEKQFTAAKTPEIAVKRVVLLSLKSPRFLYPEFREDRALDDYDVAARLALALWDSIPDKRLLDAAAQGKLKTHAQIEEQARRMLPDLRTKAKLGGFFHHWLELEHAEGASKDPKAFPEFDPSVLTDLRTSLDLFIDSVVWNEKSDYRELLLADYIYLNPRLAKLYGKGNVGEGFQRVAFDPKERSGIVTHPYLMTSFSYSKNSSPIHRGVFLSRNIVGITLKAPPVAVAFEDAKFNPSLTMREKITELTRNVNCMGCHSTINPLGFSLENYDAIGRWRTKENNKPIDATGEFATDEGQTVKLTGARDIAKYAAESPAGHRAFIHTLFHHTVKQAVGAYGPDTLEDLRQAFTKSNFNIQKLLVEIAVTSSEEGLPTVEKKVAQLAPAPTTAHAAVAAANPPAPAKTSVTP